MSESISSEVLARVHSGPELDLLKVGGEMGYVSRFSKMLSSVNEKLAPTFELHPELWVGQAAHVAYLE